MINNEDYPTSQTDFTGWSHRGITGKIITIALLLIIIASIAAIAWIQITRVNSNILEFYILNESGKADDYPLAIGRGDEFSIIAGIINNGNEETLFTIKTSINDIPYGETNPFTLGQNEKYEKLLSIIPATAGEHQKVEFALYEAGAQSPAQTLVLWINVTE